MRFLDINILRHVTVTVTRCVTRRVAHEFGRVVGELLLGKAELLWNYGINHLKGENKEYNKIKIYPFSYNVHILFEFDRTNLTRSS